MATEKHSTDLLATLPIGSPVQVTTEDNSLHYRARLIGVDSRKTIITDAPPVKQLSNEGILHTDIYHVDKLLIMRILSEGMAFAFKTYIIGSHNGQSRLLFSSFPTTMQSRSLRKENRYPCTLPGTLILNEDVCEGVVTNISYRGCCLSLTTQNKLGIIEKAREIKQILPMEIHFPFEYRGEHMRVGVKSIAKTETGGLNIGIAFEGEPKDVNEFLDSLRLESLGNFF